MGRVTRRHGPLTPLAAEFCRWWSERFPAAWPIGWSLREHGPREWLRIHSLPGSRRGPDDDADWNELLARHREVATTVLGDRFDCWIVVGHDIDEPPPVELGALAPAPVARVEPIELIDRWTVAGQLALAFAVARAPWDFVCLEPLVRASARGDLASLVIASAEVPGQLYAPYEGGADLFFHRFCEHDDALRRFRPWLSPRPDGL